MIYPQILLLLCLSFLVMLAIGRRKRNQLNRDLTACAVKISKLEVENKHVGAALDLALATLEAIHEEDRTARTLNLLESYVERRQKEMRDKDIRDAEKGMAG